jgi:putative nucleotidyltransferase with HDIG domain
MTGPPSAALHEVPATLARLAREQPELGEAYLVGGAVRDALLGRPWSELDVAAAVPDAWAAALAEACGGSVVSLGGPYELRRVPIAGGWVDVAPLRGGLDADLARRDFTVNALAVPVRALPERLEQLAPDLVIDRHEGVADLDARRLRLVSATALVDDPVRALRAARLALELDFELDQGTEEALAGAAGGLARVAAERVGAELAAIFGSPRAHEGVRILERSGLLEVVIPELAEGRGVEQRPHHTYDVLAHQLVALAWLDVLLASVEPASEPDAMIWRATWGERWPATRWGEVRDHLERHATALRIATLLHDVGKPRTKTVEADGRTRFFGHGPLGAELAAARLRALRFPERTIERVALLVDQHLRPGQVASPGQSPTASALLRFQRRLGDATPDVCFLFLADSLATAGAEVLAPRWPAYVAHVRRIACWQEPESAREIRRLVGGREVMAATGLEPGPAVGRVLAAIDEAAADGRVKTIEEALALARMLAAGERDLDGGALFEGL